MNGRLTVALISEVFWEADGAARLAERLREATARSAELAVLPELPLNPWSPATMTVRADDAEPMDGPRMRLQADAARRAGIGLVGGIIHAGPDGRRTSRSLVFDRTGALVATYEKLHLPEEPGFWETSHYRPGDRAPQRIDAFEMPVGVQLCSDINRPQGSLLLGAQGAHAILAPRATEERTYPRWRVVFQAIALTGCVYVLSVTRPAAEDGVLIGGPSIAVDPDGEVLLETTDAVGIVTLEPDVIARARRAYPGYLPIRAALYGAAWGEIANAGEDASVREELSR